MSMISIGLQGVIDAGICISHMMIAIASDSIFQAFSLLAFLKLVVFSIFELRLLLMVWKVQFPLDHQKYQYIDQKMTYVDRFYIVSLHL